MNMNLNDEHVKTLPIKDKDHVQILHFLYTFKLPIGLDDECLSSLCVLLDEGKENFSSKDKAVKTYSSLFSNLCELFLKDEKLKGKFPKRSPYHNTIHAYLFIIQRLDTGLNDVSFYLLGNFIVILNTIKFFHFELPEYEEEVCRFSENFSKGRLKFTQMIFNKGSDTGIIKLFIKICLALALKTQKITHYLNAQRKSDLSKYSQRNRRSGAFTKNEEELCKILFTDKYIKMCV